MVIYICFCSGRRNPPEEGLKLDELDETEPEGDWPFRKPVGCLMWLANQTRPDIANAMKAVARYTNLPRKVHWKTVDGTFPSPGFYYGTCDFGEWWNIS